METIIEENDDTQQKFINEFKGFLREKGGELALNSAKKVAEKSIKYLSKQGASMGSATLQVATSFASGVMSGYALSDLILNMGGIYQAGLKARYSYKVAKAFDKLADNYRRTYLGEYSYEAFLTYRSVNTLHLEALAVFWSAHIDLLGATWIEDAKQALTSLLEGKQEVTNVREDYEKKIEYIRERMTTFYLSREVKDLILSNYLEVNGK